MSDLYTPQQRDLQDRFDTRRIADLIAGGIVHREMTAQDRGFIDSRDMFFLSTVDAAGRPTVSYKGGAPGFVRAVDERTLAFPVYDGNGMFLSMGNIAATAQVGLLFIDFETPHRLRVQGVAGIAEADPLLAEFPEALFMVRVAVTEIFVNCPRYVHRKAAVAPSAYVPQAGRATPVPGWKRIDLVQPALPARDQGKAEAAGGLLSLPDYEAAVARGEG